MGSPVNRGESTPLAVVRMNRAEFNGHFESASPPQNPIVRGQWKRRLKNRHDCNVWLLGEYVETDLPGQLGIIWKRIEIAD
jgi:hypothetical protein